MISSLLCAVRIPISADMIELLTLVRTNDVCKVSLNSYILVAPDENRDRDKAGHNVRTPCSLYVAWS